MVLRQDARHKVMQETLANVRSELNSYKERYGPLPPPGRKSPMDLLKALQKEHSELQRMHAAALSRIRELEALRGEEEKKRREKKQAVHKEGQASAEEGGKVLLAERVRTLKETVRRLEHKCEEATGVQLVRDQIQRNSKAFYDKLVPVLGVELTHLDGRVNSASAGGRAGAPSQSSGSKSASNKWATGRNGNGNGHAGKRAAPPGPPDGVAVKACKPGSASALAGWVSGRLRNARLLQLSSVPLSHTHNPPSPSRLRSGDVIRMVGAEPTKTPQQFHQACKKLAPGLQVAFLVQRALNQRIFVVAVAADEPSGGHVSYEEALVLKRLAEGCISQQDVDGYAHKKGAS